MRGFLFFSFLLSYLVGSIPTAYILVKFFKGIDIRKFGSGNVGATNAIRVLGKKKGILVLIIDVVKGVIPVVFLANFFKSKITFIPESLLRVILGVFAVIGHNWTLFLKFKGGKGVATTFGVLIGLAVKLEGFVLVLITCLFTWTFVFILSRIVSLSSIITALFFPLFMILFRQSKELILASFIFASFILLRHLSNIRRLLQKKEPKI
ncbi:MAG: glycerol-3-phosphate 1-O-acyltransferase PlsY [Candidatus Omnitrophica bacterium]|nr:glycerol-3-phosphate 1-O-acyltransferase PlsY [Candidatus Omnitrophota bacterium]